MATDTIYSNQITYYGVPSKLEINDNLVSVFSFDSSYGNTGEESFPTKQELRNVLFNVSGTYSSDQLVPWKDMSLTSSISITVRVKNSRSSGVVNLEYLRICSGDTNTIAASKENGFKNINNGKFQDYILTITNVSKTILDKTCVIEVGNFTANRNLKYTDVNGTRDLGSDTKFTKPLKNSIAGLIYDNYNSSYTFMLTIS